MKIIRLGIFMNKSLICSTTTINNNSLDNILQFSVTVKYSLLKSYLVDSTESYILLYSNNKSFIYDSFTDLSHYFEYKGYIYD